MAGGAAIRPPVGDEHETGVKEFPAVEHAQDVVLAARDPGGSPRFGFDRGLVRPIWSELVGGVGQDK